MDHLSNVATEMEGDRARFIAVTNEKAEAVQQFLAHRTRESKVWIGLDTDCSMFAAYQPAAFPHTVVVGPNGRVAAVTKPSHVTAAALRRVLRGEPADLPFGADSEEAFEKLGSTLRSAWRVIPIRPYAGSLQCRRALRSTSDASGEPATVHLVVQASGRLEVRRATQENVQLSTIRQAEPMGIPAAQAVRIARPCGRVGPRPGCLIYL